MKHKNGWRKRIVSLSLTLICLALASALLAEKKGEMLSLSANQLDEEPTTQLYLSFISTGSKSTDPEPPEVPIGQVDEGAASLDWSQYQHDAWRTGYNPDNTVSHLYGEVWNRRFITDAIASTTQPIVVGNIVYIGTEKGVMYALSLETGAELWQQQLDGPVTHTAAATPQAVFVGTLAGHIYALDSQDGHQLWQFTTVGGFSSALLLIKGADILYAANRLGTVHALDINTGTEYWKTDLGYPILHSPTYGDGRVYVGAENMNLYALNALDGQIAWSSGQLYGRSFHDYAPVYAEGKVILHVMPDIYAYSTNDLELMKQASLEFSDSKTLSDTQQATAQWLNQNPKSQTFYAFEADTGKQPFVPSVLYTVVNSGAQPPPVYANNKLYSAFHVSAPMWLRADAKWSATVGGVFKDNSGLGIFDLSTGRIVTRLPVTPGEFTTDETNNYAAAGDIMMGARCQAPPVCSSATDPAASCKINHSTGYPFASDVCRPGAAPIYANKHILYQANNILTAYYGY